MKSPQKPSISYISCISFNASKQCVLLRTVQEMMAACIKDAQRPFLSAGIKHRSTEHNSSLMMSESELDSDQDTIFSQDRPVRSRNRVSTQAARNGNAFGWRYSAPPADEDGTGMCVLMRDLTSSSFKDFISQKSSAVGSLNEPMSHFRIKFLWKTRTFDQDKFVCFTQDISRLKHPNSGANTRYLMKIYMKIWRFEESDIFTDHKTDNFVCESSRSMMELALLNPRLESVSVESLWADALYGPRTRLDVSSNQMLAVSYSKLNFHWIQLLLNYFTLTEVLIVLSTMCLACHSTKTRSSQNLLTKPIKRENIQYPTTAGLSTNRLCC